MRNILVFRCASHDIVAKLLSELNQGEVVCLVQSNSVEEYKRKYPEIKNISLQQNYFNYQDFISKDILKQKKYKEIYIPSSTPFFSGFDEIFNIVDSLSYRTLILYDCNGKKKIVKNSKIKNYAQNLYSLFAVGYGYLYQYYYRYNRNKKRL